MVSLSLILDGTQEGSGPPFDPSTVLHVTSAIKVIGMPNGTAAGKPTVMIRATLPDGHEVFIETTMALFVMAARGLLARYGEP